MIGRVHRFPQKKPVFIYRLIAIDSLDCVVNNISSEKGRIHDAFVGVDLKIRECYIDVFV